MTKQIETPKKPQKDTKARTRTRRKKKLLQALQESLGIVTRACKIADIPRADFYRWFNDDKKFRDAVEDVEDIALDFVEGRHYSLIQQMHPASIIFHLKTKGRGRGYIERNEVEHSGKIDMNVSDLTNCNIKCDCSIISYFRPFKIEK